MKVEVITMRVFHLFYEVDFFNVPEKIKCPFTIEIILQAKTSKKMK